MKRILLLSLLLVSNFGFGQEPVIEWQKSLGGSEDDYVRLIEQTADEGYIIVGMSTSTDGDVTGNNGFWDYWVVKLDASGSITWEKSLGGSTFDHGHSIQQTADGGYIVVGDSKSNDGNVTVNNDFNKIWIIKLDASGNIMWQSSFGGWSDDHGYSVQQTANGGFIIAGDSESNEDDVSGNNGGRDCWIVRLDATGNIIWQKSLGGSGYDYATSIQQMTGGGYVFTGSSESNDGDLTENYGSKDCWIVKLDESGNIIWQKSFGGSGDDYGSSIEQSIDGGFVVAGSSNSNDGDVTGNIGGYDYWVVKLDASGNITWQKSLGGTGNDFGRSIQQTTDAGYIVAGNSESLNGDVTGNNGAIDYWIVKLDATGNTMWQKSLGGSGDDSAISIQQTTEGGYVVAGNSDSNNGDITGNNGATDYWIVKLSPGTSSINENETLKFSLYPNPTTETFTLSSDGLINSEFKMIDAQGREVLTGKMNGIEHTINISNLTKGVYSVVFDDSVLPVLSVIKE